MNRKPIEELRGDLERAASALGLELTLRLSELSHAPKSPEDIEAALVALAEAEEDCNAHFVRFPAEMHSVPWDDQAQEVRDDWHRCNQRRSTAVKALLDMGLALLARKREAA